MCPYEQDYENGHASHTDIEHQVLFEVLSHDRLPPVFIPAKVAVSLSYIITFVFFK